MRIHFFTDYFRPEPPPPAHHIAERARIWAEQGHDVTIITNHPNYPEGKIYSGHRNRLWSVTKQDGYTVARVWTYVAHHQSRAGKLVDHASYCASAALQSLRLRRPDVVVATTPHLFCATAGALYARFRSCPLLLEVRDLWPDSVLPAGSLSYRVFKALERHAYRSAEAVSVLTPAFEPHVLSEGARRVTTIVGGADLSRFTPGDPPSGLRERLGLDGAFVVGYPGTLGTAHDTDLLLDAACMLRETRVRFLLIGGGPFIKDFERAVLQRCPDMVRFLPTQPPESMPDWWRTMDAGLVLLKKTEAMRSVIPSKMFECMASRRPVLFVGPRGAGSQVAAEGGGLVIDGEGPEHLCRELRRLADDPLALDEISAMAYAASPRFSRERQASETLALLQRLIGGDR